MLQRFPEKYLRYLSLCIPPFTEQPIPSTPIPIDHPQRHQALRHRMSAKIEDLS
jgi:hypothetical protein